MPLVPVKTEAPFQQWGLDFIGEINPHSSAQHRWILTATDYFTKWVEAIPTRRASDLVVIDFLEENILSRFSFPQNTITDNTQALNLWLWSVFAKIIILYLVIPQHITPREMVWPSLQIRS
jgi:hypothetical protein